MHNAEFSHLDLPSLDAEGFRTYLDTAEFQIFKQWFVCPFVRWIRGTDLGQIAESCNLIKYSIMWRVSEHLFPCCLAPSFSLSDV